MGAFVLQRMVDGKWWDASKYDDRERALWNLRREQDKADFVVRSRGETMARPQQMRVVEVISQ